MFAFKKEYKPLILSGRKTQTVRIWKRCWLREGQVVNSPYLGKLRIESVTELKLSDLTQEDARLDGFETKAQMLDALRRIYKGRQTGDAKCYRVRFKYLGKPERKGRPQATRESRPRKPEAPAAEGQRKQSSVKKHPKPATDTRKAKRKPGKSPGRKAPRRQQTFFPPF